MTRLAATVTFDSTNWFTPVNVPLKADPWFVEPPGRENVKIFPVDNHLLSKLRGPLAIEGGITGADRSLQPAVTLPGETDGPLFEIGPQPELQFSGRLLGKRHRHEPIDRRPPLGENGHDPPNKFRGLSRSGSGLDRQGAIEVGANGRPFPLVAHRMSLRRSRPASAFLDFRPLRNSSRGPQILMKSHQAHAPFCGAGGKKPVWMCRSISARTSRPFSRAWSSSSTVCSVNPPALVQ